MKIWRRFGRRCRRGSAFTVVELLVAVSTLTLIVLVLFRIFDQTQRAMRGNMAQVDVMEGARAATDMLVRDLEQAQAAWSGTFLTNFATWPESGPFLMDLPGPDALTLHYLDSLYFMAPDTSTPLKDQWAATAYRVLDRTNATGWTPAIPRYGTNLAPEGLGWLAKRTLVFTNRAGWAVDPLPAVMAASPAGLGQFQWVVDGLVHFRITPLDSMGRPLNLLPAGFYYTNVVGLARPGEPRLGYAFRSNAVPAFLDVELGFLEPQAADRWRALPTPAARFRFLTNQQARVHYFQQRVRLHNAPEMLPLRMP